MKRVFPIAQLAPGMLERILVGLTLFFLLLSWALPVWRFPHLVEPGTFIPLHYNVYLGVDYLGVWQKLLWWPGFATGVALVNWLLAMHERRHMLLLSRMLLIVALLVSFTTLLALFFVILANV